jgi:hypothetical protein
MSLIRLAQLNGHGPHVYLKDILTHLPICPRTGPATMPRCCRIAGSRNPQSPDLARQDGIAGRLPQYCSTRDWQIKNGIPSNEQGAEAPF